MNEKWQEKKIAENTIYYRNYTKDNDTRTFIILKDKNNTFTLFISNKNLMKQINKDIYSINLSKLKFIPLNIAKDNDFIKGHLEDNVVYDAFISYITKLQLSNDELDEIIKEDREYEEIENIEEKLNIRSVVLEEQRKINQKKGIFSRVVDIIKTKVENKRNINKKIFMFNK